MKINMSELRHGIMVHGASALQQIGSSYYSYKTKIARVDMLGRTLYCNPRKYSVTTSKQMSALKGYFAKGGFQIITTPDWEG
jgi:hypothetical protein